ncbi:MAG TPA: PD-(D/E)XK nuclease family protein [Patescibacteria group bacterium]|nr:PD-(D/E)XK nuclease family protein [Patescibacteria group bacterium]
MKPIRLSASTLSLFEECPRCFWVHMNHRKKRPSGPFPSLPSGMDAAIKSYVDRFRGSLPPELVGKIQGVFYDDVEQIKKWRNWRTGLTIIYPERNAQLTGALDDLIVDNGAYIPLDFKTRGFAVKEGTSEFFQTQLNLYDLLLEANGFHTPGFGYLLYYIPHLVREHGIVEFQVEVHRVETQRDQARALFDNALEVLRGSLPSKHKDCLFCVWGEFEFAEGLV